MGYFGSLLLTLLIAVGGPCISGAQEAEGEPLGQVGPTKTRTARPATATPSPAATPTAGVCPCDADRDGAVSVAELVRGVNALLSGCRDQ